MSPIHYLKLSFAEVFIFENFLISQILENVILQPEHNQELSAILTTYYTDKKLVYISNRTFAYNVSPMTYIETSKIKNIIGMCIVTSELISQKTAVFEGQFYTKSFYVTGSMEDGIIWASDLLREHGVNI